LRKLITYRNNIFIVLITPYLSIHLNYICNTYLLSQGPEFTAIDFSSLFYSFLYDRYMKQEQ